MEQRIIKYTVTRFRKRPPLVETMERNKIIIKRANKERSKCGKVCSCLVTAIKKFSHPSCGFGKCKLMWFEDDALNIGKVWRKL